MSEATQGAALSGRAEGGTRGRLVFTYRTAARRQCRQCAEVKASTLARACARYSAPKKYSARADHHSQPTHGTHAAVVKLASALGHNSAP